MKFQAVSGAAARHCPFLRAWLARALAASQPSRARGVCMVDVGRAVCVGAQGILCPFGVWRQKSYAYKSHGCLPRLQPVVTFVQLDGQHRLAVQVFKKVISEEPAVHASP